VVKLNIQTTGRNDHHRNLW